MTIEQFLVSLREAKPHYDWEIRQATLIRGRFTAVGGYYHCPISAVYSHVTHNYSYAGQATMNGLAMNLAGNTYSIINAADGIEPYNRELRSQLLRAVGLDGAAEGV